MLYREAIHFGLACVVVQREGEGEGGARGGGGGARGRGGGAREGSTCNKDPYCWIFAHKCQQAAIRDQQRNTCFSA